MLNPIIAVIMMVAPSASDIHVENHALMLGVYTNLQECMDAKNWIDEHQSFYVPTEGVATLPRHIWCHTITGHTPT